MDEIEYKLKTNNSVLIVNAIDKLISTIKSKYQPAEKQKFALENEELKFLREKCSSENTLVSLTAYQGLLALVEFGVLEIGHTMSTVITLLPTAHNYSATISTMAGLLILDLRSRLIPGQPYKCQFSLRSPVHPLISVLEKNKDAEDDVLAQMHALCTHPDYKISSNSLELLRSVFFWLMCNPQQKSASIRPWQMLLSLPQTTAQTSILLDCISCQQICNPALLERAFAAYSAVTDTFIYQQRRDYVMALLPFLARISNEMLKNGRDPRACYSLIERCFALEAPVLRTVAGFTVLLLADNLTQSSALYLHELFNLCLNIISKYEYSALSLNAFAALSLQWLHLPSYLTTNALKVASSILDIYRDTNKEDSGLYMPNLKANKIFQTLLYTDGHLYKMFKVIETWERLRDDPEKLIQWFNQLIKSNHNLKIDILPFFVGIIFEKRKEEFDAVMLMAVGVIIELVNVKKDLSVTVLPILMYIIANDPRPSVKLECLKGLPLMAMSKENVPPIVNVLNKLKTNKSVPTSVVIMLYTILAETQEENPTHCRASSHGLELVSVISSILNKCTDRSGAAATSMALCALAALWRGAALAPPGTWRALEPRLARDSRPLVQISLCKLLEEIPALRVSSPEYERLVSDASRWLWRRLAEAQHPDLADAACDALAAFKLEDFKLADIPEIYRSTVRLPASHCKTPADAARKPEDVLEYIPCEVWSEVFRCSSECAVRGAGRVASALVGAEVRAYRGGLYNTEGRGEPHSYAHLLPSSVLRGLMECFRKQVTSPSFEYSDTVLLAILETLTVEYSKPLPPLDLCFLHEALHRGPAWRDLCFKLAARQTPVSPSARRLFENFLLLVQPGKCSEADIMIVFKNLSILCRGMPPNTLRGPIERCLGDSFSNMCKTAGKGEEPLFVRLLWCMRDALACDKIHDANRTLLSQIIETYFNVIPDNGMAWHAYLECCGHLSSNYLERMTSPSGWWEVSADALVRSCRVRTVLAAIADCRTPLTWLNDVIDSCAQCISVQEYTLQCMVNALQLAPPDAETTKDWLLQLMARSQIAFIETEDESAKLYLFDVFMLSVIMLSGVWTLEPEVGQVTGSRAVRRALLPAALAALLSRDQWRSCSLQILEWVSHTRTATNDVAMAQCCQRALLALRHTENFASHKIWMRL
ncbi:Uncharacterized protein KIAA1797 [Papilio xuthus]|uniref:Uncharacterized protein KIAA1797 n=1 Tax=Papilio xuthus TaxID=66420 RepID=A0A194QFE4_PAPXU|nr:Uncharacterized protein KIAA1797 [Papilio xuthus]